MAEDVRTLESLLDKVDKDWSESKNVSSNDWGKVEDSLMTLARARGLLESLSSSERKETLRTRLDKLDSLVAKSVSSIIPAGPAPPPRKNPNFDLDKYLIKEDEPTSSTSPPPVTTVDEEEYVPYQVKPKQEVRQRKPISQTPPTGLLDSTKQVQEEISHELAQMAGQLKRNALHFSGSLEKDKSVLEAAEQQLNHNYDKMQTTQVHTKTMSSKRSGTTCWIVAIIAGVSVAFFFMVLLIRAT